MDIKGNLKKFFLPNFNRNFLFRILLVALFSFLFFSYFFTPVVIKGKSMEPTLKDGSVHFLCKICLFFKEPKRGDIVGIRLAGRKVILLKRIIGVEGEKVKFKKGQLIINGAEMKEPYLKGKSDWDYEEKIIKKGKLFVVGDNRIVPIENHDFGEVSKKRLVGIMVW